MSSESAASALAAAAAAANGSADSAAAPVAAASAAASTSAAASSSSSSASASASVRPDPDFSGEWLSTAHSNLQALLEEQGFSSANAARANAAVVTQRICHSRRCIEVEVAGMRTRYTITGGWAEEETDAETFAAADAEAKAAASGEADLSEAMLAKTAEWMGTEHRRLVSSTGDLDTSRTISEDGQTMVVETTAHREDKPDIVATTTFKRVQASSTPAAAAGAM